MIILQMGDNHDNDNHEALPQQPPSLAQAVAALIADRNEQTELIRQLVQAQVNAGRGRHAPPLAPAETDYVGFLATQPPLFHKADDPLEADAWIRTIEDKFSILNCTEMDKPPLQRNSCEDLQKYGGSITRLYFPLVHVSLGMSLWQRLKLTTSLRA